MLGYLLLEFHDYIMFDFILIGYKMKNTQCKLLNYILNSWNGHYLYTYKKQRNYTRFQKENLMMTSYLLGMYIYYIKVITYNLKMIANNLK